MIPTSLVYVPLTERRSVAAPVTELLLESVDRESGYTTRNNSVTRADTATVHRHGTPEHGHTQSSQHTLVRARDKFVPCPSQFLALRSGSVGPYRTILCVGRMDEWSRSLRVVQVVYMAVVAKYVQVVVCRRRLGCRA